MAQLKDTIVSGNLRVTDTTLTDTLHVTIIKAPTSSGGSTYGPGESGQILKSNGTMTYWTDMPTIPTVNNASLTLKGAGTTVTTFTANSSTNQSLDIVAGTNVTITPDVTNHKITIASSYTNTDTKVKVTTSTSKAYLIGTTTSPDGTAVEGVGNTGVYMTNGVLTAAFAGALSGNATTSSSWATARTLTLGGQLTGSVSVKGDANMTLNGYLDRAFIYDDNAVPANHTWAEYAWHKFAEVTITDEFEDRVITFLVSRTHGSSAEYTGILSAKLRTKENKVYDSAQLKWLVRNYGLSKDDFVMVYTSTSGTSTKAELWCRLPGQYHGLVFTVLKEHRRNDSASSDWTLVKTPKGSSTHGSSSYPTTGITGTIISSDGTITNSTTGTATSANALNLTHDNELNFSKLASTGHVWFGYRWNTQGTETSGGTAITTYKFGNANGAGGLAGLEAGTATFKDADFGEQLIVERTTAGSMASVTFKNPSGILGYISANTVDGDLYHYGATDTSTMKYMILDTGNTSVTTSGSGNAITALSFSNGTFEVTKGSTFSLSNHKHTTTIAADSGTNQLTLAASTKYKLTAGETNFIFTTPPNTTYSAGTGLSLNGTTINHSNSVTAQTASFVFKKIKYDAQGHITGVDNVADTDLPSHEHPYLPLTGGKMTGTIQGTYTNTHIALAGGEIGDYATLDHKNNINISSWNGVSISNGCSSVGTLDQVTFSVNARTGATQQRGNAILYSESGNSPALIFQRGTSSDGTYDWKLYVTEGHLNFDRNSSGTWTNLVQFEKTGKLYVSGTIYSNNTPVSLEGHTHEYVPLKTNGGIATISGNGQYTWCTIATITVVSAYADGPISFEVSERDGSVSLIQVSFVSTNTTDPALKYFVSNYSNRFYIKKTATSTWEIYGSYTESYGAISLHRVFGYRYNNATNVTIHMSNVSEPTGLTRVTYGGNVASANALNLAYSNEINFSKLSSTGHVWFGYRWNTQGTETSGGTTITTYKFGNANGGSGSTPGLAGLEAGTATFKHADFGQQLIVERTGGANMAGITFKNTNGVLGHIAANTVDGDLYHYGASDTSTMKYVILDSHNYTSYACGKVLFNTDTNSSDTISIVTANIPANTNHMTVIFKVSGSAAGAGKVYVASTIPYIRDVYLGGVLHVSTVSDDSGSVKLSLVPFTIQLTTSSTNTSVSLIHGTPVKIPGGTTPTDRSGFDIKIVKIIGGA